MSQFIKRLTVNFTVHSLWPKFWDLTMTFRTRQHYEFMVMLFGVTFALEMFMDPREPGVHTDVGLFCDHVYWRYLGLFYDQWAARGAFAGGSWYPKWGKGCMPNSLNVISSYMRFSSWVTSSIRKVSLLIRLRLRWRSNEVSIWDSKFRWVSRLLQSIYLGFHQDCTLLDAILSIFYTSFY